MKVTEATLQAVIMNWAMEEKHHALILPNSNSLYSWEADLITVTQAGLAHEFEIKLNIADYRRDAKKRKHFHLGEASYGPSYFWYVTHDFDIEPYDKAGWIKIHYDEKACRFRLNVIKNAPRLNAAKISDRDQLAIGRMLSFRLKNECVRQYVKALREEALKAQVELQLEPTHAQPVMSDL